MTTFKFRRSSCASLLVGLCSAYAGSSHASLQNFDAYRAELAQQPQSVSAKAAIADGALPSQFDARMNKPTFVWASGSDAVPAVGALKADALVVSQARDYLRAHATELHLTEAMITSAKVTDSQYNGNGPAVVRFKQMVNGYEVFNRSLNVMIDRSGKLVAISGYFATDASGTPAEFSRTAQQAVVSAWTHLGGSSFLSALLGSGVTQGVYQLFQMPALSGVQAMTRQPRVKRVYYPRVGRLEPGYYVELFGASKLGGDIAYSLVVSASSSDMLFRKNLVDEAAYSYRTFADTSGRFAPYDSPLGNGVAPYTGSSPFAQPVRVGVESKLVTLDHGPIKTADPWIKDSGATITSGNNVDAYIDSGIGVFLPIVTPVPTPGDGYVDGTGDTRAANTGVDTFDYPIKGDDDPSSDAAKAAANVSLFFVNNWLHDAWYDHGFDEVAGNAQRSNLGRGGVEGDVLKVEGQDASGRNNANMATPGDGSSPRMQMYLFDGAIAGQVKVTAPAENVATLKFNGASFGPKTFTVTGDAAVANDKLDPVTDGCTGLSTPPDPLLGLELPIPNLIPDPGLFGKIALIDRGNCNFTNKAQFATLSGAIALVVVNNGDGDPTSMGNADVPLDLVSTDEIYQIPSIMIRKDAGDAIKAAIAAGKTVTMALKRDASIDRDGTLDNQVIAHEFFHYVSNRLVDDGSGLNNNQGGSMGEGWGDFSALILSVRSEDKQVAGNDRYQGAYGMGAYVTGDMYFGIRRVPYSTDFAKNPLTFKHIKAGEALPADKAPIAYGTDGAGNAEVHSAGEVWATAVWQCYAGILNNPARSFDDARSNMMDYIIAGLKETPSSPTYTEARNGILAAAMASNEADYLRCAHGFALRGLGKNAVSPDRDSDDHVGVVEDFTEFGTVPNDTPASGGGTGGGTGGGGTGGGGTGGGGTGGGGSSGGSGGGGGGAFGVALLLPLLMAAGLRRRRR